MKIITSKLTSFYGKNAKLKLGDNMKVAIGIDHNGMQIKNQIIEFLKNNNIEVIDPIEGNDPFDDYPDYAFAVGDKVASKEADLGILLCGTGIGMCIAANKIKGIRLLC